jgi:hypothetical protein
MIVKNLPIIKHYASHGGNFIDSMYLGNAFDNTGKPHYFNMMTKLFSSKSLFFSSKLVLGATGGMGSAGRTEIDGYIYRWFLQGSEEKFCRSLENLEPTNLTPGLNNTTFKIKLDVDYFAQPDVLMGEDNAYMLEIVGDPVVDGSIGAIYTVRLQTDNPAQYYDPALLEVGKEYSKVSTSIQQELNHDYGTQQYGGKFMLEGQIGSFGQKVQITDEAWRRDGMMGMNFQAEDANGNSQTVTKFIPMAEAKMRDEQMRSIEVAMMYGQKSTRQMENGYTKKTGAGLREQLRGSWQQYYNGALTTQRLQDFLLNIFYTRETEANRATTFMTGTYGQLIFHKMCANEAKSFLTVDTNYINKISGSGTSTPHLAYGAQFTRYNGTVGITVDLVYNQMYDDRRYCKISHPAYPGVPIDSFRMTVLDFGKSEGENNIQMLQAKNTFHDFTVCGAWGPSGAIKGMVNSAEMSYSVHTSATAGILLRDPSKAGELIFSLAE